MNPENSGWEAAIWKQPNRISTINNHNNIYFWQNTKMHQFIQTNRKLFVNILHDPHLWHDSSIQRVDSTSTEKAWPSFGRKLNIAISTSHWMNSVFRSASSSNNRCLRTSRAHLLMDGTILINHTQLRIHYGSNIWLGKYNVEDCDIFRGQNVPLQCEMCSGHIFSKMLDNDVLITIAFEWIESSAALQSMKTQREIGLQWIRIEVLMTWRIFLNS